MSIKREPKHKTDFNFKFSFFLIQSTAFQIHQKLKFICALTARRMVYNIFTIVASLLKKIRTFINVFFLQFYSLTFLC